VINARLADSLAVDVGDTLVVASGVDATGIGGARGVRLPVTGVASVRFDLADQRTAVLPLAELQRLAGRAGDDPASFVLGKLEPGRGGRPDRRGVPRRASRDRCLVGRRAPVAGPGQLSYFQQFSLILGTVSLLVTFLLILTLLTLSVNERQGEIAILRAVGLPARRVVQLVLVEGMALTLLAIGPGIAIGSLASRASTRSSGVRRAARDLSFFVFTPEALVSTFGLVLVTGTLAGAYPAFIAARTDVVRTLHQEVT